MLHSSRSKAVLASLLTLVLITPAFASDIVASLKFLGAFDPDTGNPVSVNAGALPIDQPLVLAIGAYAKLANPGNASGVAAFSVDVVGIDGVRVVKHGSATFPTQNNEPVWNAITFDTDDDLVLVTGSILPLTAPGTWREHLGNGSPADEDLGVQMFAFTLLSQQVPGTVNLNLATHTVGQTVFTPFGLLVGDQAPPVGEGDNVTYNGLTLNFVPEPATLSLLLLGGLAVIRKRK